MRIIPPQKAIFSNLLCAFLASLLLTACNPTQEDILSEVPSPQAEFAEDPDTCGGSISYSLDYDSVDVSAYYPEALPYDYAVMISYDGPEITPPADCFCTRTKRCITLTFPHTYVAHAGIAEVTNQGGAIGPITMVPLSPNGKYIGHEDPVPDPGVLNHTFCSNIPEHPAVIFFNLNPGYTLTGPLVEAISGGTGICIIGDLPDPRMDPPTDHKNQ